MKGSKVRTAKNKGSQFEYDCLHNLQRTYPDMYLTSKQGFQQQYDLRDDKSKVVVECKRHKSISWNQAKKWFLKLKDLAPEGYDFFLLFKGNQQPVLRMWCPANVPGLLLVEEFEFKYGFFEKHLSTRNKGKKKVLKE